MDAYNALIFRDAAWAGSCCQCWRWLGMAALFFAVGVLRFRFD